MYTIKNTTGGCGAKNPIPSGNPGDVLYLVSSGVAGAASDVLYTGSGNLYAANSVTTTNVFATRYYGDGGLLSNVTATRLIQPLANLVVSNSVTTTNVFATTANVGTLNVWQVSNLSTLAVTNNLYAANAVTATALYGNVAASNVVVTPAMGVTGVNVLGNIYASNAVTTTNVFTTNVYASNVVVTATAGMTGINVLGNIYASNAVTTTNVFATGNVTVGDFLTVGGLPGFTSLNVTGNVYASNAVTTTNVFATGNVTVGDFLTVGGLPGFTSLNVTGNVYASNAVTTTNVFTTNVYFASGLTTATPAARKGAFEFNGTGGVFYSTPQLVRGISPSQHFYMQTGDVTFGTTVSGTPAAAFPAVTTGITLQPGKYYIRSSHIMTVTSSLTAGTTRQNLIFAGSATYTVNVFCQNTQTITALATLQTAAPRAILYKNTTASQTISAGLTNTNTAVTFYTNLEGQIDVSVAGTFLPRISIAGGGDLVAATPGVRIGSFILLEPLGPSATIVNVGGWA